MIQALSVFSESGRAFVVNSKIAVPVAEGAMRRSETGKILKCN